MFAADARSVSFSLSADDDAPVRPARGSYPLVDDAEEQEAPPWQDKLQAVPAIRSALIPIEGSALVEWSSPFSLVNADFEPWLSYYKGYLSSRLFLQISAAAHQAPQIDYPVRAYLELKGLDWRYILSPPVQIDGPVEYFDAKRAPQNGRQSVLIESLTRASEAMHRSQLRRAQDRGRDMGNQLHDAILGEGLINLILAWERKYQRKPSPHELHLMLTTGRTLPVVTPEAASAIPQESQLHPKPSEQVAPELFAHNRSKLAAAQTHLTEQPLREAAPFTPAPSIFSRLRAAAEQGGQETPKQALRRYLIHLGGAAGVAILVYLTVW